MIIFLLIFSVIIFHSQIFNSGLFDNIINNTLFGGYCSPFLKIKKDDDNGVDDSLNSSNYSGISLCNVIRFDYIITNIEECIRIISEKKNKIIQSSERSQFGETDQSGERDKFGESSQSGGLFTPDVTGEQNVTGDQNVTGEQSVKNEKHETTETGKFTYAYELVTFNKKYIDYLYKFFGINLSNFISYINYAGLQNDKDTDDNKIVYSYNDNLAFFSLRKFTGGNIIWAFTDVLFLLPLMFCLDTIRKAFAYNIIIYTIIYKLLYNTINEGLLLIILGFLFVYYPTVAIKLILSIPCFVSGFTFCLVFICNFLFQTYNYIKYSIKVNNTIINEEYKKCENSFFKKIRYYILYFLTIYFGTFLKIITVIFMMFWFGTLSSSLFTTFLSVYMIIFLYIIIPFFFKGNTLNQDIIKPTSFNEHFVENTELTRLDDTLLRGGGGEESVSRDFLTGEDSFGETVSGEPSSGEPSSGKTVSGEPVSRDFLTGEPLTRESVSREPVSRESVYREPVSRDFLTGSLSTGEPLTRELSSGESSFGESSFGETVSGEPSSSKGIIIDTYVNQTEDYSIINVCRNIFSYKARYTVILIIIIVSIDFISSGILSYSYSWIFIFFVIIYALLFGLFYTKLSCTFPKEKNTLLVKSEGMSPESMSQEGMSQEGISPESMSQESMSQEGMSQEGMSQEGISQESMSQKGGGNYFTDFVKNWHFSHKIKYDYNTFSNNTVFDDTNPYQKLKSIEIKKDDCKLFICRNAYTHNNYNDMIAKYLGYKIGDINYKNNKCPTVNNLAMYQPPTGMSNLIINMIDYLLNI